MSNPSAAPNRIGAKILMTVNVVALLVVAFVLSNRFLGVQPVDDAVAANTPAERPASVEQLVSSLEARLERYRADALQREAAISADALESTVRHTLREVLEEQATQRAALGAASDKVAVELGEKAQALLELVAERERATLTAPVGAAGAPADGGETPSDVVVAAAAQSVPTTRSAAAERPQGLRPGESRRLREVHFSTGSASLSPGAHSKTMEALGELQSLGAKKVRIVGFSDTAGAKSDNLELSRQRASAVAQLLMANGFDASQIEVIARGEAPGPYPTADGVDEPLNRCVGIFAVN